MGEECRKSSVPGVAREAVNFRGLEIKGQGFTQQKMDLEAWQRHQS